MHIKASELTHLAVVSIDTAAKVGEVDNVFLDLSTNTVVGFRVRSERFTQPQILPATQVKSVGPDAITIATANVFVETLPTPGSVSLDEIEKAKVVTTEGTYIGKIHDFVLDTSIFQIQEYILEGSFWEALSRHRPTIPRSAIVTYSPGMIMVKTAALGLGDDQST